MVQSMASKTFIDFNELCRLCATKTSIVLGFHIFQHEGDAKQILKKITSCLPIEVVAADKLPKMICEQCVFKLDMLFEFREKTIQTETFLLELLKSIEPEIQNKVQNGIEVTVLKQSQEQPHYTNCIELRNDVSAQEHQHTRNDNDQLPEEQLEDLLVVTASHHNICNNNREENCVMLNKTNVPAPSIHKDNNVKCEPDVLIKVEETINVHLNDSESETESDTDDDDENGDYNDDDEAENGSDSKYLATETQEVSKNEISVIQHKNFESHLPSERLSNHESISSSVMFDGSSTFVQSTISPAANGLLLLSCSQNPKLELKGGSFIFCNMCGKAYAEQEEFQTHYETHCNKCSVCSALFTNEDALNVHFQEMHLEHNNKKQIVEYRDGKKRKKQWVPKICKDCGKQYRTNYKLMEHMRKHTGEKPFTCTSCPKAFRSKIGLAQHEAKHTGEYEFSCNTCGKGFQCKSYLIVHQRVHSTLKPYPCLTCGCNFKTKQSLLDHQNRHLGVKPYLCETCGRRFITKGLCKSHQKIHSGLDNKQFPCVVCGKMFVSKSYLATHIRIHTGEKPFMCEVCGKGFLTRVDLRIHSTMHSGEKSFVCEWCGKAFARRDALRCHRRSHTGERPYRCEVCGQSFTQFSPLTIHKRLHTGERPYPCEVCGKAFVSRSTLTAHTKKHHV